MTHKHLMAVTGALLALAVTAGPAPAQGVVTDTSQRTSVPAEWDRSSPSLTTGAATAPSPKRLKPPKVRRSTPPWQRRRYARSDSPPPRD